MIKKTISEFIEKSNKIHKNKYDYSKVKYINGYTKVKIACPIHGEFEQTPSKHTNSKQGCRKCFFEKNHNDQRKDVKDFIKESKKIHGNKYDYSLVNYKNGRTNIKIVCPIHGIFEQAPSNHLQGKGCKYCGGTAAIDTNIFIEKSKLINGDKYDYSLVNYKNSATPIKLICPEHGEFEQLPNNHLSKEQGCFKCLDKVFDLESFIEKSNLIHNNLYDYSKVDYSKSNSKVKIICPIHGEFEQTPASHIRGSGCHSCGHINSKQEKEITSFLKSLSIEIIENSRLIIPPYELDIYIPSYKIGIEFNGIYWHSDKHRDKEYHLNKTKECDKLGFKLIHIFEDEWIYKKNIVKSRLKNILGLTENKIHGRKCEIKEVSSKDVKLFLNENHIQGNIGSKIKLGLYYENELVSLMTFGHRPMFNSNQYEIIRFCNKLNTTVIGGAQKLLKYFIKNYNPKEIISYADKRWSQGNLYEKLGFTFISDSPPNFYYVIDKKRYHRINFQKHKLIKQGYDKNKSESQIMLERGINKIYDCGSKKYSLLIS